MVVNCPNCSVSYQLPDNAVDDKPRKMRCSSCQHVFTIKRREKEVPTGYVEYTGKQHLPDEFAFLQEDASNTSVGPAPAPKPESPGYQIGNSMEIEFDADAMLNSMPPDDIPHVENVNATQPMATISRPPSAPPEAPTGAPAIPTPPSNDKPNMPPAPGQNVAPPAPPQTPQAARAQVPSPAPVQPQPPQAAQQPATGAQRQPSGVEIYGGSSSWETEAPLDLSGYSMHQGAARPSLMPSQSTQLIGKIMTGFVVLVVIFFIFVAFRNGWSLSFDKLPTQIGFAFSTNQLDAISQSARDISAVVMKQDKVITKDGSTYLLVSGEVTNESSDALSQIILRGRIVDPHGETRKEIRLPCGKVLDKHELAGTPKNQVDSLYSQNGVLYDCALKAGTSTLFNLAFNEIPPDFNAGFDIQVVAVAAKAE